MNENDGSTARGFDPDTAPDLSKGGWPEKFAKAPVRRGRPPKARPKVSTTIRLSPPESECHHPMVASMQTNDYHLFEEPPKGMEGT